MATRREEEVALVAARYGKPKIGPEIEWLIVSSLPLPPGWSKSETPLLIQLPPGYPYTPPYGFGVDPELRLENGGQPGNAGNSLHVDGRSWMQFSYSVEEWFPHADPAQGHNLLTFLLGVEQRLRELG